MQLLFASNGFFMRMLERPKLIMFFGIYNLKISFRLRNLEIYFRLTEREVKFWKTYFRLTEPEVKISG